MERDHVDYPKKKNFENYILLNDEHNQQLIGQIALIKVYGHTNSKTIIRPSDVEIEISIALY